jgi:uncharacterized membrane protein
MRKTEGALKVEINHIYSCIFDVLAKRPVRLWGLSLLSLLLMLIASILGVLPIISLPIVLLLCLGNVKLFYAGYNGEALSSDMLFYGFKGNVKHYLCGMGWMLLWIFIWALIPFAGIFIAISKIYAYRFVPYILINRPEVAPMDALRLSIEETRGLKGRMFGADIVIILAVTVLLLILSLLGLLPIVGWIFRLLFVLMVVVCAALLPLVINLLSAAFYTEAHRIPELKPEPEYICPNCGRQFSEDQLYCGYCGFKLSD